MSALQDPPERSQPDIDIVDDSLSLLPAEVGAPGGLCVASLSSEGWSLTPIVDWLFGPGCAMTDLADLLQGLCDQLVAVGAPVMRVRLGIWAIHPQRAAYAYSWTRASGTVTVMNVGHGIFSSPDYIGSPTEKMHETRRPVRYRLDRLDPTRHHSVLFDLRDAGGTDYIGLPMPTFTGRMDSLFFVTDREGGFDDHDIAKFRMLARMMLPVVEALTQHQLSISILNTYVGPRTGQRVLAGHIRRGEGERIDAALWYCDLRNFTAMTETVPEQDMLDLMNLYFEHIYNSVSAYGGEVLRFIGDAMLIVFPTGDGHSPERACDNALAAAVDAVERLPALNAQLTRHGLPAIRFGIGLDEGTVTYGNVGAADRLDFTVMGPAVNRTSRIETLTKRLDTPILMSEAFADHLPDAVARESCGSHEVTGMAAPIAVYRPILDD